MVIDGIFSSVGSYNIDKFSSRRNLEINLAAIDTRLAGRLEEQFGKWLRRAREISPARWKKRPAYSKIIQWIMYRLAGI